MRKIPLFSVFANDTWVKPFLKKYRKLLTLALFLGFLTFFFAGGLMFISGYLISRAASLPENILMIYIPIVFTRGFGIARPVSRYLERLTSHNWVLKMTSKLRLKLYQVLEQDAIFFRRKYSMGDVLGLLAEDINHIQNLYLRTIFPTVIAWVLTFFITLGLGYFSWPFALFMLLILLNIVVVMPLWSVLVNGARQEKEKQLKHALYSDLTDNVLGVSDWIFSQRGQEYVTLHDQAERRVLSVQEQLQRFNRRRNFFVQALFGVAVIALLFWTSQRFPGVAGGKANWIAAFVLSVFPFVDAFAPLSDAAQEANMYKDSLDRLNNLPAIEETERTPIQCEAPYDFFVDDVCFNYEGESKQVLHHLTLTIPQGETVAILGRSGSGKSTLAHLLRGDLTPTSGTITLGGHATAVLGDAMSDYVSVMQQTPYLFRTTIANNLRLGNNDATVEQLWEVLDRVGLKSLVEQLPDGLHTLVDEAGLRFSGGERHRLALARILLKDTPIVLLDEPTVGLDPITEQALIDTLFATLSGKTIIWITHHLQGIEKMQRVIFLEDGQLEMSGSPAELAATNARYQKLKAIDEGR